MSELREGLREVVAAIEHLDSTLRRIVGDDDGWLTVRGFAVRVGRRVDRDEAKAIGRRLTAECLARGTVPKKVAHDLYDSVNAYPRELLEEFRRLFD